MAALKAHFALKALVVGLGVVILAMLAAVVVGMLRQADKLEQRRSLERAATPSEMDVAVPVGCSLAEVLPDEGLLILRLDGPAERGCQQAVIIDPSAGAVVGRVRLQPEG